jgi:hypothetical protein
MVDDKPQLTIFGKLFILLVIAGSLYGAYRFLAPKGIPGLKRAGGVLSGGQSVEIGIAYGTEKERWLQWAVEEFAKTDDGRAIKVNLIPMGSLEGAKAIVAEDKRINVWSPASSLYKEAFLQDWQVKNAGSPILKEENLALTPMVFVMWDERYQAFVKKYKAVSFSTIASALAEKGGWNSIAGNPDWGLFKFGHTHPNESNSGLVTLVLMAYDFQGKSKNLTLASITDVKFQTWLRNTESAVSGLPNSTGNLMREMVLKGPSSYDAVFVYESVAIDYMKNAEGRWGKLRIIYPRNNMWNENPYYIINAPWCTDEQKQASETFLKFLLTEPIQKQALQHGFRPGNPNVPVKFAGSPFLSYQSYGLKLEPGTMCEPPKAEVINNLLASWERSQGGR